MVIGTMKLIGQKKIWTREGLCVEVEILDVRQVYGKLQVKVTPVSGYGWAWKDLEFLQDISEK